MANCVFGWPIWSDVSVLFLPTLSGGSWSGSLPLTNLQNRELDAVARSTDDALASTQFEIDLKTARAVRVLALPKHNLTPAALVRFRGSSSAGVFSGGPLVYDSGWLAMSFAGLTAEDLDGFNYAVVHVPAAAQTARYWLVEIDDTANPDNYVELGRLVIAGGYQPTFNMSYGAKVGLETDTGRTVTDGGAAKYQPKPVRRICTFALEDIPTPEAFANSWKMQRKLGTSGQIFFVFDPADTTLMHERAFLGVLKELTALDSPYFNVNSIPYSVIEDL